MKFFGVLGYWFFVLFIERLDTNTGMMHTDDYRGRYQRHWRDFFDSNKFTRGS